MRVAGHVTEKMWSKYSKVRLDSVRESLRRRSQRQAACLGRREWSPFPAARVAPEPRFVRKNRLRRFLRTISAFGSYEFPFPYGILQRMVVMATIAIIFIRNEAHTTVTVKGKVWRKKYRFMPEATTEAVELRIIEPRAKTFVDASQRPPNWW
jgi:hypothetical protein